MENIKNIFSNLINKIREKDPKFITLAIAFSIFIFLVLPAFYLWIFRTEEPRTVVSTTNLFTIPGHHRPERDSRDEFVIHFSENHQRFAYRTSTLEGRWFVVLNGREQKEYDSVSRLTFGPGNNFAYAAKEDNKWFVVLNGEEQDKRYESVSRMVFSPDGKNFAYNARERDKWFVVLNGEEQREYDSATSLTFASNNNFVYVAKEDDSWFVVFNGLEQKRYKSVTRPTFSPDGKNFAYNAKEDDRWLVVLNGEEQKKYETTSLLGFSPNNDFVYTAKEDGNWFVVLNGKEKERYDSVHLLTFGPSNNFAYAAKVGDNWFVVLNGEEQTNYSSVSNLIFSEKSNNFAYVGRIPRPRKRFVVLNGEELERYDEVDYLLFGPEDKLFYVSNTWNDQRIIIGENIKEESGKIYNPTVVGNSVYYNSIRGREIWIVIESFR